MLNDAVALLELLDLIRGELREANGGRDVVVGVLRRYLLQVNADILELDLGAFGPVRSLPDAVFRQGIAEGLD